TGGLGAGVPTCRFGPAAGDLSCDCHPFPFFFVEQPVQVDQYNQIIFAAANALNITVTFLVADGRGGLHLGHRDLDDLGDAVNLDADNLIPRFDDEDAPRVAHIARLKAETHACIHHGDHMAAQVDDAQHER